MGTNSQCDSVGHVYSCVLLCVTLLVCMPLCALLCSDILYLLYGDGDKKRGLLESCGNVNIKNLRDIKKSSVLALELVCMLLNDNLNPHADTFLECIPKLPLARLQSMKLERHILSEQANAERAYQFIVICQEQLPQFKTHDYVQHTEALEKFQEW